MGYISLAMRRGRRAGVVGFEQPLPDGRSSVAGAGDGKFVGLGEWPLPCGRGSERAGRNRLFRFFSGVYDNLSNGDANPGSRGRLEDG